MIFTYWEGDSAGATQFMADWQPIDPTARIFNEAEVTAVIAAAFPRWRVLFERIAIPACKSDIARLVLLYQFGGFYVDAHTAPGDRAIISNLLADLEQYDLILFLSEPSWLRQEMYVLNGALLGRKQASVIAFLVEQAFSNLLVQCRKEVSADQFVEYNIAVLTGGWLFASTLFDLGRFPFLIKPLFRDRVRWEGVDPTHGHQGFEWYKRYEYRKPGTHWSERQKAERLFDVYRRSN